MHRKKRIIQQLKKEAQRKAFNLANIDDGVQKLKDSGFYYSIKMVDNKDCMFAKELIKISLCQTTIV